MRCQPHSRDKPYFGGKSTIADIVWQALDQPKHYIEPFFGSGAVLLARPGWHASQHIETVNDADGMVCNVWRALQHNPDEVARWCDWPVNHADLMARRIRLLANEQHLLENLTKDDGFYDAKLAGYWIWAASCWIGSGLTHLGARPNVADSGHGVHKLGKRPNIAHGGRAVHKLGHIPHLATEGKNVQEPYNGNIYDWFRRLSERLRYVSVICGDWTRVCGGDWQDDRGIVGLFFDPPYGDKERDSGLYHADSMIVSKAVEQWCLERGSRSTYRIVLAGYEGEHGALLEKGWHVYRWKAQGGYANMGDDDSPLSNRYRERLFLSPHCQQLQQLQLWEDEG